MRMRSRFSFTIFFLTFVIVSAFGIGISEPRSTPATRSFPPLPAATPPDCHKIAVVSKTLTAKAGDPVIFEATVLGANDEMQLTYEWKVSQGKIVGGQGTAFIRVLTENWVWGSVEATVEVGGLAPNCANKASAGVKITPASELLPQYIYNWNADRKKALEAAVDKIKSNPDAKVALVGFGKANDTDETIRKNLYADMLYLESKGVNPDKITVVIARSDEKTNDSKTRIYLSETAAAFEALGTVELTTLVVKVKDRNGVGIAGVKITIRTMVEKTVIVKSNTRGDGSFSKQPIPPGQYEIIAVHPNGEEKTGKSKDIEPQSRDTVEIYF